MSDENLEIPYIDICFAVEQGTQRPCLSYPSHCIDLSIVAVVVASVPLSQSRCIAPSTAARARQLPRAGVWICAFAVFRLGLAWFSGRDGFYTVEARALGAHGSGRWAVLRARGEGGGSSVVVGDVLDRGGFGGGWICLLGQDGGSREQGLEMRVGVGGQLLRLQSLEGGRIAEGEGELG